MAEVAPKLSGAYGRLPDLLDALGLPALGCGPHGQAAWANKMARQLFGGPSADGLTDLMRGWGAWYDADRRPLADEQMPLARVLAGETIQAMEVVIKPQGAAPRFFLVSGCAVGHPGPGGAEALIVLNEITARRRLDQISSCQRHVGELLAAQVPVEQMLPEVVATIAASLEWAAAEFWAVDDIARVLRRQVAWDPHHRVPAGMTDQVRRGEGLPGLAWEVANPVWALDLHTHPASAAQVLDWATLRAGLAVPVPSGKSVVAILVLYSDSPEDSGDARAALLPALAAMIGQMLERRRAERLDTELDESRSEYINLVGHEVRTPLAALESCTDLLTEDPQLTDDQGQLLAVMRRNTKSMHGLVDKLLDMAALRAGDITIARRPVNLTAICRDAARFAQTGGVPVEVNTPDDDVIIDGDPARMRQVIDELLHAADDGSPIGVNLRSDQWSTVITVTRNRVAFPADAPGAGVPGTALGFTLIRAIVEAHHGDMALNDTTDPVATYTIRLPSHHA